MVSAQALRRRVKRAVRWDSGGAPGWRGWARSYFQRDVDAAMRYGPALRAARRAERVLEVGSGPSGIVPFVSRSVVGVDLSFAGPRHHLLRPVIATGTRLPFADRVFDLVLCFDVLEHVPPELRADVMRELARVGEGTLLVAVPFGPDALCADREARQLHRRVTGEEHRWLSEHELYGTFQPDGIAAIEAAVGRSPVRRIHYGPIWLFRLLRREEILFRPHLMLLRRFVLSWFPAIPWRLPARRTYRTLLEFDLASGDSGR